ncbi:MAG: hypothetical protein MJ198_04775 [Bacteroidales bacterium]|nr:hypothetical protein [Bacteroidales bacterium]
MCEILKLHGFHIEHLSDNKEEGTYDITLNGIPADLKRMTSSSNIVKNASYAIHKQNAQLIIFQFDKWDDSFREKVGVLKQKHIQGYYFLTSNPQRIHRF